MPKWSRLVIPAFKWLGPDKLSGFQNAKTKWPLPFESRTQKVSERWPFESRINRKGS
jgi:hypothetical protein